MMSGAFLLLAYSLLAMAPAQSDAGGARLGVGGEAGIGVEASGPAAAALSYDMGNLEIVGLFAFGFVEDRASTMNLGLRGYFVMHQTNEADISLGGGLGFSVVDPDRGDTEVGMVFEGGGRIRAFVIPNVALTARLGIGLDLGQGQTAFAIQSHLVGGAGVLYYF